MANWSNPLLTSTYTNFVTEVKDRDTDLALQFDGTTSSNIPTNAIRWNSSVNRWQKWNGSSWGELTSTYALTGLSTTGGATIGGTLGSGAITSTGSVTGTALIPSGSSAPTNGLYLAGTNTIGLATNSAGRVFIDAAGEVGIGTSTPETCLDIALGAPSATIGNVRVSSSGQARYHLYNGGGVAEWLFGQKTISNHSFILSKSVAGSESDYLTVDTTGRVGIGTTNPSSLLEVNGTITIGTGAGTYQAGVIGFTDSNWGSLNRPPRAGTIGAYGFQSFAGDTRMVITDGGNVGIGTTGPQYLLHVNGSCAIAGDKNLRLGEPSFTYYYDLGRDSTTGSFVFNGNQAGSVSYVFQSAGTERFRINSAGLVGIGTSSPNTRLHLNDGELTISTGGNTSGAGGIINFGIAALPLFSPMATIQGLLTNATGSETQGGLGFFTRLAGAAGQSLQRRMTITDDGSIGIGTTAPYSRFTVVPSSTPSTPATANQITVGEATGNSAYRLQLGYLYDTLGRGSIQAYDNGNPSPLILNGAGGNVGIGTSSPSYILDLNSGGTTPAQIGTTVNWNFPGFILRRNASNVSTAKMLSMMLQGDTDSDTTLTNHLNIWGTYSAAPTTGSTTAGLSGVLNIGAPSGIAAHVNGSQRWIVTSAGRFGLGTTAPGTSFDVALAAPSATIGNIRISPSSPGQARYHLYNGGATAEWLFGQVNSTSHDFTFSKSVGGSESEYLRIGASGQIGIGGANYGTTGQALTSNGPSASPSWATVTALTAGTAVSATGTAVDFTGIPSSAKRITVMIDAVGTNASATLAVQLGDSGGIETSGYTGGLAWTGPSTGSSGSGSAFPVAVDTGSTHSGHAVITKVSGNTWVLSSTVASDSDDRVYISGGSKGLSATLDRIRITTTAGSASFDSGTVNILYE
jgi:hypothetical protein